ncbi:hypothetical protein EVAR_64610_1 [Eumeta japonica]|uniref:Uncharacterized protein n=1 Tax=Eumeta variegata TaxID=151549 RepID=A0A4C1ZA50_EUMVA|nr:hypothetical protein EVAR_64610_1 [Eumeta japonica]
MRKIGLKTSIIITGFNDEQLSRAREVQNTHCVVAASRLINILSSGTSFRTFLYREISNTIENISDLRKRCVSAPMCDWIRIKKLIVRPDQNAIRQDGDDGISDQRGDDGYQRQGPRLDSSSRHFP